MKSSRMSRREFTCIAAAGTTILGGADAVKAAVSNAPLRITIIGDSACIPDIRRDVACFVINYIHLIDTGCYAALKMRDYGLDPLALESIIIPHFHHDHYLGLPGLLFFAGLRKKTGTQLTIAGPVEYLERVVKATDEFLQVYRFPELKINRNLVPLTPGDKLELSDVKFDTFAANHLSGKNQKEPALVYKVTEKASGACAVFTGDTHHHPPIAGFARGASLLIYDASHTAPKEAALVAQQAGVNRLVLIHYAQARAARILEEARTVFPNTELAEEGNTLEVSGSSK